MLIQRIITALILIPISILGIIYLPPLYFALATALILSYAAWEWSKLSGVIRERQRFIYLGILWLGFIAALFIPAVITLGISFLWWLIALVLVCCYPKINKKLLLGWPGCVVSILVLVPCWVSFSVLRGLGLGYIFSVLVVIWAADTGAYFVGRFWGKHKLSPEVSPKKTLEGLAGGGLLAFIVGNSYVVCSMSGWQQMFLWLGWLLLGMFGLYLLCLIARIGFRVIQKSGTAILKLFPKQLKISFLELVFVIIIAIIYSLFRNETITWQQLIWLAVTIFIVVLFATLGDLFESLLKRIANVKDSGSLLPGHGGVLDRTDSVLAAMPIFALEVIFVAWLLK